MKRSSLPASAPPIVPPARRRQLLASLTVSAAGLAAWVTFEGSSPVVQTVDEQGIAQELLVAHTPTKGDVPTIGYGSTRFEDGTPVTLNDAPITRERAVQLVRALMRADEKRFQASLPGVALHQEEYDLYLDFVGQFGIGNWRKSSMRRHLLAGEYGQACAALLRWRYQGGRDCSLPTNWGPRGCKGVWTRQLDRHARCLAAQG